MAIITGAVTTVQVTLLIVGFASLLPQSEAIRCWRCRHTKVSNDDQFVKIILKPFTNAIGNEECELKDGMTDKYALDVVECPSAADSGMTYKCSTVRGKVTTTILTASVVWDTTVRDCVQVPTGDPEYKGCKETEHVTGPLRYLLEESARGLDKLSIDADVQFKGKTCYDLEVSSIPPRSSSIQCVTCSRNELTSETSVVGDILKFFTSKTANDECLMENLDDTYRVGSRICPEPERDEQAVCGVISGEASSSVGVKFLTTERGCIIQPKGKQQSGCTTELPPDDGAMKKLLKKGIDGLKLDITFKGYVCYSESGLGKVTASGLVDLVGRGDRTQRPLSVFVLALCGLLAVVLKTYF